jgi:Leucine-rich repeat (LRR) protein
LTCKISDQPPNQPDQPSSQAISVELETSNQSEAAVAEEAKLSDRASSTANAIPNHNPDVSIQAATNIAIPLPEVDSAVPKTIHESDEGNPETAQPSAKENASESTKPKRPIRDQYHCDPIQPDPEEVALFHQWLELDEGKIDYYTWKEKFLRGEWKPSGFRERMLNPDYNFEHFYELQREKREERLAQYEHERRTGENTSNGCKGLQSGDVWNRNNITDIIKLIKRQQQRREKIKTIVAIREKKLDPKYSADPIEPSIVNIPFLDEKFIMNQVLNMQIPNSAKEEILDPEYSYIDQLFDLQVEELASLFPGMVTKSSILRELEKEKKRIKNDLRYTPTKLIAPGEEIEEKRKYKANRPRHRFDFGRLEEDDITICMDKSIYRPITKLSTQHNLKYLYLGNENVDLLFEALHNDEIITHISLANARISRISPTICQALSSMTSLIYLDLSQNSLRDDAILGDFLAVISNTKTIRTISLAANKLSYNGIMRFLEKVLDPSCLVSWIR